MADAQDFKVGDVVKLKSGGPEMTVQSLTMANGDVVSDGAEKVQCAYFTEGGELKIAPGLPLDMLEVTKESPREDEGDDKPATFADTAPATGKPDAQPTDTIARQDAQDTQGPGKDVPQLGGSATGSSGASTAAAYDQWKADRATPGMGNADNNSPSGLNRPMNAKLQSADQGAVHEGDDRPQTLGNTAEAQPAQQSEIAHTTMTSDPNDGAGTVHEPTDKSIPGPQPSPMVP